MGIEPLKQFVAACERHPAGADHELTAVFNLVDPARQSEWEAALEPLPHRPLVTPEPMIDLAAYHWAVSRIDADAFCFVNSYARPLADDWLAKLLRPLERPEVGMTGATGSFESNHTAFNPRMLWTQFFPRFPNTHLRTNGLAVRRETLDRIGWRAPRGKIQALWQESGHRSISKKVMRQGLELLVVGADGSEYKPSEWEHSGTFRSGEQQNLLIADNRTDHYQRSEGAEREHLRALAWG